MNIIDLLLRRVAPILTALVPVSDEAFLSRRREPDFRRDLSD
jgi:hypothetical protein